MDYRSLGGTGLSVSSLAFGASALGGVFHAVDEAAAIRAVHAALDAGITCFDVAPAYGATRAEALLGKALTGVPRQHYLLATKVGKYTGDDGRDFLDYRAATIRSKLAESAQRLGTDRFDILHIHDIEYDRRRLTEQALTEGLDTVRGLQRAGRVGAVGLGFYPIDLWQRVIADYPIDVALVHNHCGLHDTRIDALLPLASARGVGVISASPFGSGLLTERGAPSWHPATANDRAVVARAAGFCRDAGTSIEQLAFQFACQRAPVATTLFSAADPATVVRNIAWAETPFDPDLVAAVRAMLAPIIDRDWY
jgi:L-galactose dehydrogenase